MFRSALFSPGRHFSNTSTSSTVASVFSPAAASLANVLDGVRGFATWNHKPKKKGTRPKRFIRVKQETIIRCRSWFHAHKVKFGFDNVHEMERHKQKDLERREKLRLYKIRQGEKDMSNPSWCTEKHAGKVAPYPQAGEMPALKNVIVEGDDDEKINATAIKAEAESKIAPEVLRKQRIAARKFDNYLWYFDEFKEEQQNDSGQKPSNPAKASASNQIDLANPADKTQNSSSGVVRRGFLGRQARMVPLRFRSGMRKYDGTS